MTPRPTWRRAALAAAALAALTRPAAAVDYTWTGGDYVGGVTSPNPLAGADRLLIDAGGFKFFNGASFVNAASVVWRADALYLQNGAVVNNAGLWDSQADTALVFNGGAATAFVNGGTFRKSAGSGDTVVGSGVGFVNSGTIEAQSGRVRFDGGSTFNAGSVFTGAGSVVMNGNNSFAGAFTSDNLVLAAGTHAGSGALLRGTVAFGGGAIGGTWTVAAGQALSGADGGFKYLDGAATVLTNQGTIAWNTTNAWYLQNGATLANAGLFVANADTSVAFGGGAGVTFDNTGTVRAAGGKTLDVGSIGFVNHAVLDATAGSTIRYSGGTARFEDGTRFSGAGVNRVVSNASFAGGFSSQNLELAAGSFNGEAATLGGAVAFSGGALTGRWQVAGGQTLNGVDGGFKYLDGAATVLTNAGTIAWNTTNAWYLQNGATLANQGLFVADADTSVTFGGGATSTFDNTAAGTVRAAAGRTLTIGNLAFVNDGGALDAEAGAAVVYGGGNALFNEGTRFTGAGLNRVTSAARFAGAFDSANLVLQNGTFSGIASGATLRGTVAFAGGTLGGLWQVAAGQTLAAQDGGFKYLDGAATVLTNAGTIAWNTTNAWYLQNGATLSNRGLFVANADTTVTFNGGAATTFDNTAAGTVRAAAGKTLTVGNLGFVNHGGALDAEAGAAIVYGGGTAVFEDGTRFAGAGLNRVTTNASFRGGYDAANLRLENGAFGGEGAVMRGTTRFAGGTFTGTWQLAQGHAMTAGDGGFKYLDGAATQFVNDGTVLWQTTNAWYLQNGAALRNEGRFELAADGALLFNGGAGASFVNTGLVVKTGGVGSARIGDGLGFDNRGTVEVESGTIALPTDFTNAGVLAGAGSFALAGTLRNAGHLAPGAPGLAGTLGLGGNYAQTAAGVFDVDLQALGATDLFTVGGTAALDGTLALNCLAQCSFAVGSQIVILDAGGALSGSFAAVTLHGFGSGAFDVVYDTVNDRVLLEVTQAVTAAVPEPGAWALWLAGAAVLAGLRRRRAGVE